MATGFVNQFTTGRPYVNPTVAIARPQMNISIPQPPEEKKPPTEDPTNQKNPTENKNPNGKGIANPKSTGHGNNIWGTIGKDLGIGAGVVASGFGLAKGLGRSAENIGSTGVDLGKAGLELGAQGLKHGADITTHEAPSVGRNLLNWGEDTLHGIGTGAKAVNKFGMENSGGGGLENAIQGTGHFSPAGSNVSPLENVSPTGASEGAGAGGLKMPDSWGNIGTDLADVAKGDFTLAA